MQWIYLDNNATTQPAPEVIEAVREVHERLWANPSSVHRYGQMVRQRVELARASVASLIDCLPREIIFTSGGTESNNLALYGVLEVEALRLAKLSGAIVAADQGRGERSSLTDIHGVTTSRSGAGLITTPIEHPAVREPAEALQELGVVVHHLPVVDGGWVTAHDLAAVLEEHIATRRVILVSIQWANNETGSIQPVSELANVVRQCRESFGGGSRRQGKRLLFHVDATQAVGKIPVDVRDVPVDLLTLSAHKFHGPKGVGALFVRDGVQLRPLRRGGPQERQLRGGTENTAGIIGMGVAAELAQAFVAKQARVDELQGLRDQFEEAVLAALPDTVIHSKPQPTKLQKVGPTDGMDLNSPTLFVNQRLWNTSNLSFPSLESEAILLGLSERGLCASAGSACSSGSLEPSPVLRAMGVPDRVAHGSVRFSLSRWTQLRQIKEAVGVVVEVVNRVKKTMPMPP